MTIPRNGSGQRGMPDARSGGGYASLKNPELGADSQAELMWPYKARTQTEIEADTSPDREKQNRKAIEKRNGKHFAADRLQQLNYKTGSFVNGSTRGLTGIMSGVDPRDILEAIIKRVQPRERIKPIGNGAPFSTMSSDATTRTRPGMTLGSKAGWFGAPPPKDTDPTNLEPAYSIQDVIDNQDDRPLMNVEIEKRRAHRRNRANESKVALLRSYVLLRAASE